MILNTIEEALADFKEGVELTEYGSGMLGCK